MNYRRNLLPILEKQLNTPEIIVLTGMRRVGKTTLYRTLFDELTTSNKIFLDIENPLDQKIFEEIDYNNIWKNLVSLGLNKDQKAYVFLDEIQAVPEIVKPIKFLYDHYQIKFFLTGSSSFYLKNLFPESLAGRKIIFELFPLSFQEFLTFKNHPANFYNNFSDKNQHKSLVTYEKTVKLYEEYLQYGGFPGIVTEPDLIQKKLKLNDIFKSYYEKDIKGLADFRDLTAVRDLILLLTQRIGSRLDITKLSSELGISRETVYSYLSFLEATYFISSISPFSKNIDREISGRNKIYFCDTGILNELSKIPDGSIFENAVFNNIKHLGKINYYQKRKSEREIDFIIDEKVAIEVKNTATKEYLSDLSKLCQNLNINNYYLISKNYVDLDKIIPATNI
jgi:uncharacterized protein